MQRGEQHDDAVVAQVFPQEALFVELVREHVLGRASVPAHLRSADGAEKVYRAYVERAITPTGNTTVAGKGLEFVPENMDMRIQTETKYVGGFADLTGLSVATQNNPGVFKALKETAVVDWEPAKVDQAADLGLLEPATADVDITMEKRALGTVLTDEQLMMGNADLQAFIIRSVGRTFGKVINDGVTKGAGPTGLVGILSKTARKVNVGTAGAIDENDFATLFSGVDFSYVNEMAPLIHVHPRTIIHMWTLRDAGVRLFPSTPDGPGRDGVRAACHREHGAGPLHRNGRRQGDRALGAGLELPGGA